MLNGHHPWRMEYGEDAKIRALFEEVDFLMRTCS